MLRIHRDCYIGIIGLLATISFLSMIGCGHNVINGAFHGDFEKVKAAIEDGESVDAKDEYGNTALLCAARYNHYNIASYLLRNGANVNAKNDEGKTAMIFAAIYNHYPLAELLIKYGAEINVIDKTGNGPLSYSAQYDFKEFHQLLLEKSKP